MKLITLVRLLVIFIKDKGWWREFVDEIEKQGYSEEDVKILTQK